MPKFLQNQDKISTLIIPFGSVADGTRSMVEVGPGRSIPVIDQLEKDGAYSHVLARGLAKIVSSPETPAPLYTIEPIAYKKEWSNGGMSIDDLPGYLAAKAQQEPQPAGKVTGFGDR